jgi:KaiC/GvpD/RAD55 family RecA-like ATPase
MVRRQLGANVKASERNGILRFVDAYSWSSGHPRENEKFSVKGTLDLEQLATLVSEAGADIGQSVQRKEGGKRVIDSISSLLVNFDLPAVQKFLSQIGRTAVAFGGVTTLFVVEEGAVSEHMLNNIKYLMDGVLEFKDSFGKRKVRALNMKWLKFEKDWVGV